MNKSPQQNTQQVAAVIARDCLVSRVRYLNRSLTAIYDEAFRPFGITASQVNMLVAVINRGSLSPVQLSEILNIEKSTLSRNLERMRKAGWIEIIPPASGRTHAIQASNKGKKLLCKVLAPWEKAQKAAGLLLDSEGSTALRKVSDHARRKHMNS